jgi:hypothetical protein
MKIRDRILRKTIHNFSKYVIVLSNGHRENFFEGGTIMGRKLKNIVRGMASLASVFPTTAYSDFNSNKKSDWQVLGEDFVQVGKNIDRAEKKFSGRYLREKEA